jgi:hypothetical protein
MQKQYRCTPAQFITIGNGLASHGITVGYSDPNNGVFTSEGVTLGFSYNGTDTITWTILKKGILPTASMVWDALDEYAVQPGN